MHPSKPTFAEQYCAQHRCAPHTFPRRIFWHTLPWYAVPFAPLLLLSDHFEPDRQLIASCAVATGFKEVCAEIDEHGFHPQSGRWLRRRGKMRISRRRLLNLARTYLAGPGGPRKKSAVNRLA